MCKEFVSINIFGINKHVFIKNCVLLTLIIPNSVAPASGVRIPGVQVLRISCPCM